jgi:hypothetical protein
MGTRLLCWLSDRSRGSAVHGAARPRHDPVYRRYRQRSGRFRLRGVCSGEVWPARGGQATARELAPKNIHVAHLIIEFDLITDHDLDREGDSLLRPYRAVVTGSHPEYHTPNTLGALQDYVDGGGRLAYLGGNGFYGASPRGRRLRMCLKSAVPRAAFATGAAEPGEYFHALDGGYGVLWCRNGRSPQMLCGVRFSAQGLFDGSYNQRMLGCGRPARRMDL